HEVPVQGTGRNHDNGIRESLVFPEVLDVNSKDSPVARLLHREFSASELRGDAEFAAWGGYVVTSVHRHSPRSTGESETLDNEFRIFDAVTSKVVYTDTIAHETRGPVPDAFFLWNNAAYFIKDQKTLTAIKLSGKV
ncbi:MAG TPA: hypothetical protein VMM37_01465, partial [Bacteroidota bacterium]|nr:hypothetical protein [Bacteroidota bacterium]